MYGENAPVKISEIVAVETATFKSPFNWKVLVDNSMEVYTSCWGRPLGISANQQQAPRSILASIHCSSGRAESRLTRVAK